MLFEQSVNVQHLAERLWGVPASHRRFRRIRTHCTNARKAVQAIRDEADGIQTELEAIVRQISAQVASALESSE